MKRVFGLVACAVLLSGCHLFRPQPQQEQRVVQVRAAEQPLLDANGAVIERVPFRAGVSSATVEKMAKREGCVGGPGAGLMTPQGPIEVYRMVCENRTVYKAMCELRQCRKMN